MAEIKNHSLHLKQLTAKAMTNKAESIKELIDYLLLAHAAGYVLSAILPFILQLSFTIDIVTNNSFSL